MINITEEQEETKAILDICNGSTCFCHFWKPLRLLPPCPVPWHPNCTPFFFYLSLSLS